MTYSKLFTRYPERLFIKIKYVFVRSAASSTATELGGYVSGNDVYAPDPIITTESPYGFQPHAANYTFWCVFGSKIRLNIYGRNNAPFRFILRKQRTTTLHPGIDELSEQPYTTRVDVAPQGNPGSSKVISKYGSTMKMYGLPKDVIWSNPLFWGNAGSSPSNQWYWIYYYNPMTSGGDSYRYDLRGTVTYYCCFFQRNEYNAPP